MSRYKLTFLASLLVWCWCSLPTLVQADTIKIATGLANGKIRIEYDSGKIHIEKIFAGQTSDPTHIKELSSKTVLALQANGRKLAWINAAQPQGWVVDKISLTDDIRYTSATLRLADFGDATVAVVIAQRGATVDVMAVGREDGDLLILDLARLQNKNIELNKITINENQNLIQLRDSQGRIRERVTAAGADDLHLLTEHDPVDCADGWYETHVHMEDLDAMEDYVAGLEVNNVACSLLFVGMEWDNISETYSEVQAIVRNNPGRFVPFYNSDPNTLEEISVDNMQAILDADEQQLFRGIGEFAFYQEPLLNTALTSAPWPEIFQWAADNNLIIMIHLNQDQSDELDAMLTAYPDTTVLLHGKELANTGDLATLLAEHTNLYFTLDTANMIQLSGVPLMFPVLGGDDDTVSDKIRATDFAASYDANETTMLADANTVFADIFSSAPNQILWGTDVAFTWHTRTGVYQRLLQFSQLFADHLTSDQQTDYFMNNAMTLFGSGVTLE